MQHPEKFQKQGFGGFWWQNAAAPNGGRGEEGGADPGEAVTSLQSLHSSKGRFSSSFASLCKLSFLDL